MRDLKAYVDEQLAPLGETWRGLLRLEILQLAEQRRDLLDKAIAADDTYLQALGELDFAQRQLSEAVDAYNDFLDERLLWVRTGEPPTLETLSEFYGVSRERIRQIEAAALGKLRKAMVSLLMREAVTA